MCVGVCACVRMCVHVCGMFLCIHVCVCKCLYYICVSDMCKLEDSISGNSSCLNLVGFEAKTQVQVLW